jgi:hypothetical protein
VDRIDQEVTDRDGVHGGGRTAEKKSAPASTAGTLDGGEGLKTPYSLPSISLFAHGDAPAARSGQGCRTTTDDASTRRQAAIRPTDSPK